eukprot:SAG22_NODE_2162_length_2914_cov_6.358082_3_plen_152_part_00
MQGVNCIHMLTDFTRANGCTRAVLGSHRRREVPPPAEGKDWTAMEHSAADGEKSSGCIGPAGSVAILCNNTWHAAGANVSTSPRVGAAISYIPWYLGRVTMDLVPITPAAYAALQSPVGRGLCKHQLGWDMDIRFDIEKGAYVGTEPAARL